MSDEKSKGTIEFTPGSVLEARDFSNTWYPAKVVEVDLDGREVLVHFLNWSSRFDEWISMDSARLRPKSAGEVTEYPKGNRSKEFQVGDKVIALWKNSKKYPARVTRVINENLYEVIFIDGFVMEVRAKNMSLMPKEEAEKLEIPASTPSAVGSYPTFSKELSKEERKKRKSKIDVVSLFKTYHKKKTENDRVQPSTSKATDEETEKIAQSSVTEVPDTLATAATSDLVKKERLPVKEKETILVNDEKLPTGWEKRAVRRNLGTTAGKWDVTLCSPDGRSFRSRQEVRLYLHQNGLPYDMTLFDFRLGEDFYRDQGLEPPKIGRKRLSSVQRPSIGEDVAPLALNILPETESLQTYPTDSVSSSAPVEDGLRCPLDDCRKLFRRENLLMMHIKHYHPALSKQLGCRSIKVEDMAAARTAYETEEGRNPVTTPTSLATTATVKPLHIVPSEKKLTTPEHVVQEEVDSTPLSKRARVNSEGRLSAVEPILPGIVTPKAVAASLKKNRKKQLSSSSEKVVFTIGEPETPSEITGGALSEDPEEFDFDTDNPDQKAEESSPVHMGIPQLDSGSHQRELVHCYCGILEEDGLMIQCEVCLAWQHGICLGIENENGVPDPYICQYCRYPYRERPSRHYSYDQTWIKKGKIAGPSFVEEDGRTDSQRETLRVAHALISASLELKEVLHSLRIQADIAKKKDHPKLYLWSKQETVEEDSTTDGPSVPRPEPPINSLDCRFNLLQHVNHLQDEIESRLTVMEAALDGLEGSDQKAENGAVFPRTLQTLLKDVNNVKKMAAYSARSYFA